jgi:hypothetical protein
MRRSSTTIFDMKCWLRHEMLSRLNRRRGAFGGSLGTKAEWLLGRWWRFTSAGQNVINLIADWKPPWEAFLFEMLTMI